MKILFYGDVVGKIGRRALALAVPADRKKYAPDLVIANVENAAHGKSVTESTLNEIKAAGVDAFTSGNHILSKPDATALLNAPDSKLIRPENFVEGTAGRGALVIDVKGTPVVIMNFVGQVFMKDGAAYTNPFTAFDTLRATYPQSQYPICFVDFHAEVTSEKNAFGWHVAGQASVVVGTHTHIPTADQRVLEGGTAYVTDVGMTGGANTIIGLDRVPIIEGFTAGKTNPVPAGIPETGPATVNAILVEIDEKNGRALGIVRVDSQVEVV